MCIDVYNAMHILVSCIRQLYRTPIVSYVYNILYSYFIYHTYTSLYIIHHAISYIYYTGPHRILQAAESARPVHPTATRRRRCWYNILYTYIPLHHYIYIPYILYTYFCTPILCIGIHNILHTLSSYA